MTKYMPGLKLDRLIAEKVLGWHQDEPPVGGPRAWWFSPDSPNTPKSLPNFSEDIKAAWRLVVRFKLCVTPYNANSWTAFPVGTYHEKAADFAAINAPHAICLAALAEVESDDD